MELCFIMAILFKALTFYVIQIWLESSVYWSIADKSLMKLHSLRRHDIINKKSLSFNKMWPTLEPIKLIFFLTDENFEILKIRLTTKLNNTLIFRFWLSNNLKHSIPYIRIDKHLVSIISHRTDSYRPPHFCDIINEDPTQIFDR